MLKELRNNLLSFSLLRGTQVWLGTEECDRLEEKNQIKPHPTLLATSKREKRTSGSCSPFDCPHTGQAQTVASFLRSPINSSPGRLAACSRLAFLATSSFPFPILRSFVCEGPNVAETIYRLLSCTSCRGQECWPNN